MIEILPPEIPEQDKFLKEVIDSRPAGCVLPVHASGMSPTFQVTSEISYPEALDGISSREYYLNKILKEDLEALRNKKNPTAEEILEDLE